MLLGTGCKLIKDSTHGKQPGSGGNGVATAIVEAVVAGTFDSILVGALGVGEFGSGARVGNAMLGLVAFAW